MELTLNGARIHYERAGSGLPVILLHAGIADSRMWGPQVDAFAREFDVIRPDMRGFGRSEMPAGPWSPVDDVLALIDELGLKPVHLIGCSMGGELAIDFALEHAERISKLVLVGSAYSGFEVMREHGDLFKDLMAARQARDYEALNDGMLKLFLDGPKRPPGYVAGSVRQLVHEMNERAVRVDFEKSPPEEIDPPAAERLAEITAPTLVMVGDADVPTILEAGDQLTASIPHARKAVIEDAAHLPNLEHPDEFNRLVLEFLLAD
jgi:pimeloyl-ACP methyl ester carboxylesterase